MLNILYLQFSTKLNSSAALAHKHHLSLYKCTPPAGQTADEFFGGYVGLPGGECYVPAAEQVIPTDYCRTMLYVWAIGGKPMYFPPDVAYPITEEGENDYIMFEVHYNNPGGLSGVEFTSAVEIFNVLEPREKEAGLLLAGHPITFSHLIPPKATNFVTISHCGPECTGRTIEADGINLFNVMLHSHLLG